MYGDTKTAKDRMSKSPQGGALARMISKIKGTPAPKGFRVTGQNDERSCELCKSKHGQSYNAGASAPPYHPHCRCQAH